MIELVAEELMLLNGGKCSCVCQQDGYAGTDHLTDPNEENDDEACKNVCKENYISHHYVGCKNIWDKLFCAIKSC